MHPHVILRNVAGPATHFIDERSLAILHTNFCADAITIGAGTHGLKRNPMVAGTDAVHQQARRCIHIVDGHRELAIVPEVPDGQTAGGRGPIDPRASIRRNISKGSVTVVVIEEALLFVGAPQVIFVYFRVHVAVSEDKIRPTVIIEVKKHSAPPQILRMSPQAGAIGDIRKNSGAFVAIQCWSVI